MFYIIKGVNSPLLAVVGDESKPKVHKTVSDIDYKGNALDIIHGLNSHSNGCRELQQMTSFRSLSNDRSGRKTLAKILQGRYHHNQKFSILPSKKVDKEYSDYMPHDRSSILQKKVIKVKMCNDPHDLPLYDSKLRDKNCNSFRHLMSRYPKMSSLKWVSGLRDYKN